MLQRDRFHIPNSYLPALFERHLFIGMFKERWDRAYIIYAERCPKNNDTWKQIGPLFDKRCADINELRSNLYQILLIVENHLENANVNRRPYDPPNKELAYTQLYNEIRMCLMVLKDSDDGIRDLHYSWY